VRQHTAVPERSVSAPVCHVGAPQIRPSKAMMSSVDTSAMSTSVAPISAAT